MLKVPYTRSQAAALPKVRTKTGLRGAADPIVQPVKVDRPCDNLFGSAPYFYSHGVAQPSS